MLPFLRKSPPSSSPLIILSCLALSLALHVCGFLIWKQFPPSFTRNETIALHVPSANTLALQSDEESKTEVLKEVFNQLELPPSHFRVPFDVPRIHTWSHLQPLVETLNSRSPFSEEICKPDPKDLVQQEHTDPTQIMRYSPLHQLLHFPPTPHTSIAWDDLHLQVPLPLVSPFSLSSYPSAEDPQLVYSASASTKEFTTVPLGIAGDLLSQEISDVHNPSLLPNEEQIAVDRKEKTSQMLPYRLGIHYAPEPLEYYAFPILAKEVNWSEDFVVESRCLRRKKDWLFSLAISPAKDITGYDLPQHFLFVLDRTNPRHRHRFYVYQRAVLKALTKLQKHDTFNIAIIDKKTINFHDTPQRATLKTIRAAEEFLEKEQPTGLLPSGNFSSSLEQLLTSIPHDEQVTTAILLSDGFWSNNTKKMASSIARWLDLNRGKFYAYAAAVGEHNDLAILDLFSQCNGGGILWSDTHAAFPRKLAKLILDLRHPVLTNVIISAASHSKNAHVEFLQLSPQLPAFRGNGSYTILGRMSACSPFDITIHGRRGNQWVTIKKTIFPSEGNEDTPLEQAAKKQHLYSHFLTQGSETDLHEARALINHFLHR